LRRLGQLRGFAPLDHRIDLQLLALPRGPSRLDLYNALFRQSDDAGSLGFARDAFDKLSISACGSDAAQEPQFRRRAQTPAKRLKQIPHFVRDFGRRLPLAKLAHAF
jgi:hypothetical protein